jgi:hypothetical protein
MSQRVPSERRAYSVALRRRQYLPPVEILKVVTIEWQSGTSNVVRYLNSSINSGSSTCSGSISCCEEDRFSMGTEN